MNVELGRLAMVGILAGALGAQTMDGNLVGAVADSSGGAIASAHVTLVSLETGVEQRTIANAEGGYRFNNVAVGRYRLTAAAPNFAETTVNNVYITLNKTPTVNLTLEPAQVRTSVEVSDAAASIDTTTAHISSSFGARQAAALPFTGSGNTGVLNLSLLNAGVTTAGGIGYGTGPSVGGQRPANNNFMIEGVDNNLRVTTGPVINVSNEAVSEFSVQQNLFSVEFGHSNGGQFNTVVKNGTNELHGSGYYYLQNRHLNAVDEQFKRVGVSENPRFDQNRFGASLGGPVRNNRWFYFGNIEYMPQGLASAAGGVQVPTQAAFETLDRIAGLNRRNLDVLKREVPVAPQATPGRFTTVAGTQIPLGLLTVVAPSYSNDTNAVASSDYYLSERDQLRARYLYYRQRSIDSSPNLPQFYTPVQAGAHVASLTHLRTISPAATNELRFAYNRRVDDRPVGPQTFPGLDSFPNLAFADLNLTVGPFQASPQTVRGNTFQLVENFNWIRGRHTFKFGYDGRKVNLTSYFIQYNRGEYQYATLERYLLDLAPTTAIRSTGGFPFAGNLLSHYAFANDEIRLRPNLTINVGMRYEYVGVPAGSKLQSLNSLASVPGVIEFREPKADLRALAPRVGLAWSPDNQGRTSIRAGFGLGYDQIFQNFGTNSLPPQFFTTQVVSNSNAAGFLTGGGIPNNRVEITSPATARASTSTFVPDQQRPYSIQWSLGVQRVLGRDYTVEARYVGTRGIHLPQQIQMNRRAGAPLGSRLPVYLQNPGQGALDGLGLTLASLRPGVHPLQQLGFGPPMTSFQPLGNSTYHGLATQLTKRYSRNLLFTGAYTWSKNIDDSTANFASTLINPRRPDDFENLRLERGLSALDRRHRLSLSWVYDTPWLRRSSNWALRNVVGNWSASGAYAAESGAYITPRSGLDVNFNTDVWADRTYVNPAGAAGLGSATTPLRNSSGAVVAYLATNPNARYIAVGQGGATNAARNTLRMPGINNVDFSLAKRVSLGERTMFEFRAEAYNAFNHAQFVPGFTNTVGPRPRVTLGSNAITLPNHPDFNRPDRVFQSNARVIQLVGRLTF